MLWDLFTGKRSAGLERVEARVQEMLELDRREFDLAMGALLGDHAAADVNAELRATDRNVNELERQIRRDLLTHAILFGRTDSPAVLVHMSIAKDLERVGDYAKNLLDLARDGANFGQLEEAEEWRRLAEEISAFIPEAGAAFQERDEERSRAADARGEQLLRHFDARVTALVSGEDRAPQGIARAIAYRYLKRVVAHLMNLLSAVTMPLDHLDQFDEDPEDRSE